MRFGILRTIKNKIMTYSDKKELLDPATGLILHMKSLLTIHGEQYIEVYGSERRYKINELTEVV